MTKKDHHLVERRNPIQERDGRDGYKVVATTAREETLRDENMPPSTKKTIEKKRKRPTSLRALH